MNLIRSEKEILQLVALIARWKEQKYIPQIERDIALSRVRQLYTDLLETELTATQVDPIDHHEHQPFAPSTEHSPCEEQTDSREMQIDQIASVIDQISASQPIELESNEKIEVEPEVDPLTDLIDRDPHCEEVAAPKQDAPTVEEEEARRRRFIHDLFCNDEAFYIGEMRKIELLPTLDDVLIYIGQKYAWSPMNPSAEEFVAIISSKFDN